MPSVIDRFQNLFRSRQQTPPVVTSPLPPARPSALVQVFNGENDRRSLVQDCRKMYEEDTRAQGVIDALGKDTTRGGFELVVEGPRAAVAKAIAEEMLERVGFWERVDDWVRLTLRDGDTFLELGATGNGDIVEVTRKPTLEMVRMTDDFDRFTDAARAFVWTDKVFASLAHLAALPAGAVAFAEWQILHVRFHPDENQRYGRPLFAAARKPYKRMSEGELDIAIRRKTRAGMKYVHSLEDASDADIEAYRLRNQDALDDPFAAVADFFSSKRTTIQAIQGDANLAQIDDVVHHIRTWWVAAPVPMSLLGYGQDLNRDVLDAQGKQYDRACEELSRWASEQIVRPLIERQWLLKGIWPAALQWEIEWASKEPMTAVSFGEAAKALAALRLTGLFADETLLRMFARFVPDFDVETELAALEQKQADEIAGVAANAAPDMAGTATDGTEQNPSAPPAAAA